MFAFGGVLAGGCATPNPIDSGLKVAGAAAGSSLSLDAADGPILGAVTPDGLPWGIVTLLGMFAAPTSPDGVNVTLGMIPIEFGLNVVGAADADKVPGGEGIGSMPKTLF